MKRLFILGGTAALIGAIIALFLGAAVGFFSTVLIYISLVYIVDYHLDNASVSQSVEESDSNSV